MERYKIALSAIPLQEKFPGKLHMIRGQKYGNLRDSDKRSFLSGSERSVERFSKQLIPYWEAR